MPDPAQSSNPKSPNRPRKRLLLVDDNLEGRRALARLLELYGFEVTAVGDGSSAIEALHRSPPPEFVLTDLLLPDLDGREVARQARELRPVPTIAMITGWDLGAEGLSSQDAGVDLLFLKPLNVGELVAKLNEQRPAS
jgi:CheY-like chemotaxis protein